MTAFEVHFEIDVSGYNCPIPLLRTKKTLSGMAGGQVLRVVSTDPGSEIDFRVYTEKAGHALLACEERDGAYVFVIRKAG
jgi:tRNA 2-thiouridine synthesizing protein A